MRMNISIQLDESDLSLLELLGAILGEETIEVSAPIQEVESIEVSPPVQEEPVCEVEVLGEQEVEPLPAPAENVLTCASCSTTETSQWRAKNAPEGPLCNICWLRNRRANKKKEKENIPDTDPVVKSVKHSKTSRIRVAPLRGKPRSNRKAPTITRLLNDAEEAIIGRRQVANLKANGIVTLSAFSTCKTGKLLEIMGINERHVAFVETLQMKGTMMLRAYNTKLKVAEAERKSKKSLKSKSTTSVKSKWPATNTRDNIIDVVWDAFCAERSLDGGVLMASTVWIKAKSLAKSKYDFGDVTMAKAGFNKPSVLPAIKQLFIEICRVKNSPNFMLGESDKEAYIVTLTDESWPTKAQLKNEA
jgi:hypothetical protein